MVDPADTIRARRQESNAAIAARDADRVTAMMAPGVTVAVAGGPVLRGRDASRAAFAEQFADRNFRGYVRTVEVISVDEPPVQATESGQWLGRWQMGLRTEEQRGSYVAQWRLTDSGWMLESEIFT